jgi:hypothetical protein
MPIIGRDSAALGVYSVISCKKTVKAKRIVIVSVIFSPLSGGSRNTNKAENNRR